jgi:uncharacterized membrane protein (UPF0127 family)
MSAHFLRECVRGPETAWAIQNATTGTRLASRLLPAFDRETRNHGLLGRNGLAGHEALVLAPCSGVHTWFMRFPIDILFVSKTGTVLKVRRAVGPWRLALRFGAFAVVEMAAGASAGTEVGHQLSVVPASSPS